MTLTYRKVPRMSCDFGVVSDDHATAAAALAHLHDVGHLSDLGSRSAHTWSAYQADCDTSLAGRSHGLPSLPASPSTVALYRRGMSSATFCSTLADSYAGLIFMHKIAYLDDKAFRRLAFLTVKAFT